MTSRERETKIFRSSSAKVVQKFLAIVQFFNFHAKGRLYFNFHVQERPLFYLVFTLQSKALSYNFYHIFFYTIFFSFAFCALKYHHNVAVTNKAIFGPGILFEKKFSIFSFRLNQWYGGTWWKKKIYGKIRWESICRKPRLERINYCHK